MAFNLTRQPCSRRPGIGKSRQHEPFVEPTGPLSSKSAGPVEVSKLLRTHSLKAKSVHAALRNDGCPFARCCAQVPADQSLRFGL